MKSIKEVDENGYIRYKNEWGDLHRIDGPAIEDTDGYKAWIINGLCHREDGPAVVYSDGTERYYLNGLWYSVDEWDEEILKMRLKRIKDL